MTTVDKVHNIFLSFKGRSPRQVYIDASKEFKAKVNSGFAAQLSDQVDDFYALEDLDLSGNYFGPKGCLAVLKIVQCQQRLRSLNLSACGCDDIVIAELVEVIQDHPRLRDIVLADNPDISVFSGKLLARVVKLNVNVVNLDLSNTHIGRNVANVLQQACEKNRGAMEVYFSDDWFRMKDMFLGLDVDGSGWVNIKNMVGSVTYPMIQEKLEERIRELKPRKREDNCIDVTTFMELTYLNFKNRAEINTYADEPRDPAYDTVVSNWGLLLKSLEEVGAVSTEIGRLPHRETTLTARQCKAVVEKSVELQKQRTEEANEEPADPVDVSAVVLREALKTAEAMSPLSASAKRRQSFLDKIEKKHFAMPPSLVRVVLEYFESAPPQGLVASKVLDSRFETEFEVLKLDALAESFKQYSIPMEVTLLTVEETINLLDEFYDIIRVPKRLSADAVKKILES